MSLPAATLWFWRHPAARGQAGRCIGRTDLPVDRRRARRLARRIRRVAQQHGLPRAVWVSPLARCRAVGWALRALGFRVVVDARLRELDFGRWDGRPWGAIPEAEVTAWADDLLDHAPGDGEPLRQLALRAHGFAAEAAANGAEAVLVVGHGGWVNALRRVNPAQARLAARDWPPAPGHGALVRLSVPIEPAHRAGDPPRSAPRGTRSRFDAALAQVPDLAAQAGDQRQAARL